MYVGTIWHLEDYAEGQPSTSSTSRSSSSPPTEIERDPESLWEGDEEAGPLERAADSVELAAHLSRVNIPHKSSAGLFIPAMALRQCLQGLGQAPRAPLDAVGDRRACAHKKQRRGG